MVTDDSVDVEIEQTADRGASHALAWLVAAGVLLLFANGRHTVAAAAWLAPVFLLRFVRSHRASLGLSVAWLVLAGTWAFQFRGMAPGVADRTKET